MKNTTSFRFLVSRVLIVSLALSGVLVPELHADTITVEKTTGDGAAPPNPKNCPGLGCRLRDALAKAGDRDIIDFASSIRLPATISLTTALVVDKNVTISGPGLDANEVPLLSISGGNQTPVFEIFNQQARAKGDVVISSVSIISGRSQGNVSAGGIRIREDSSLRLEKSHVSQNRTGDNFGTGGIMNLGHLVLRGCTVKDNTNTNGGGGTFFQLSGGIVNMPSGVAQIFGSTISGNCGARGGGIENLGQLTIEGQSKLTSNHAMQGGAIINHSFSLITLLA
jgi:hypothetical protein